MMLNIIAFLSIYTSLVYNQPGQIRGTTDYYQTSNGDICITLHHTMHKGSEFLRLHIRYRLRTDEYKFYAIDHETYHYMKRVNNVCNRPVEFFGIYQSIFAGLIDVYLYWDLNNHVGEFHYELKNELDTSLREIISTDNLFAIPVRLSRQGTRFIYKSPVISEQQAWQFLSTISTNNRALCVKVDNHKIIVIRPIYFGNIPQGHITQVKIHLESGQKVVDRTFNAYSCGADPLPVQSDFKLSLERPLPSNVEFFVVAKQYTLDAATKQYVSNESTTRFYFNLATYEFVNDHTNFYYPYPKIYIMRFVERPRYDCDDSRKVLYTTSTPSNQILFGNMNYKDDISSQVMRYQWLPLEYSGQCQAREM